jgi:ribonuclease BN (tRNA processing enzyme)
MKIKFLGRGGAFAPMSVGNSNMMITADSGKRLMFDFGSTAPYIYRDEWKLDFADIDAIYISHLHADHCNLEMFAFHRYFLPKRDKEGTRMKPKLFANKSLMKEMWDTTLRGGLESLQGQIMSLTHYFDCYPIADNKSFTWEGYYFTPIQTVHVRSAYIIKHSYGLAIRKIEEVPNGSKTTKIIRDDRYDAYITSDTQFDMGLVEYYDKANVIFSDCETGPYKSVVHPHYSDLKTLPERVRNKMWLYHYNQPEPTFKEDGFLGFVEKGQEFVI